MEALNMASLLFFLLIGLFTVLVFQAKGNPLVTHAFDHATGAKARPITSRDLSRGHRPTFKPGSWKKAASTFYEGSSTTFGGACGYKDVANEGYGVDTAALSTVLFNDGQSCGSCYEIKCVDSKWCKQGNHSLLVTATNFCPPNYSLSNDDGGWCNPPREHFDLAMPSFLKFAEYKGGIVPVHYRRVPCKKEGGIKFTISGNPYFYQVLVWNVGGAGDVTSLRVKGDDKLRWTYMTRLWGQTWVSTANLTGESLTFRVGASDGRFSTSWHVCPKDWQFGQSFEGKNFL